MGFRLVPKSVNLNDVERRNGHFCVISPNSAVFVANYENVVKLDISRFSPEKCHKVH